MKILSSVAIVVTLAVSAFSQAKPLTAREYREAYRSALEVTSGQYPHTFTDVSDDYEKGKKVSSQKTVAEREDEGKERSFSTITTGRKVLRSYSIMMGSDNQTYCSRNGIKWTGPQEMICPGPDGSIILTALTDTDPVTESAEYSATVETVDGQPLTVYRKVENYPAARPMAKKTFIEETLRVDSSGALVSLTTTYGTLAPKLITGTQTQTWDHKAKFKPVVAPK